VGIRDLCHATEDSHVDVDRGDAREGGENLLINR
jgi:hypothetical protein